MLTFRSEEAFVGVAEREGPQWRLSRQGALAGLAAASAESGLRSRDQYPTRSQSDDETSRDRRDSKERKLSWSSAILSRLLWLPCPAQGAEAEKTKQNLTFSKWLVLKRTVTGRF
jgi:hypothetical protein